MSIKKINVTKTFLPDPEKFKAYVDRVYETRWVTNRGELARELEERLKAYLGVPYIVLVANGTLALQVAYRLLELRGDVITTPFSFVATTSSLVWEGLEPVFADIDPGSLNISPEEIEKAVTDRTSAVVPVHIFGNACEVEAIREIARAHSLKVIYDASHAFGVKYQGRSILNFGDISTLSFHATKLFHTIEGGAIVTSDREIYEKAQAIINFGYTGEYDIACLGINAKMNEFEAAMGLCMLDRIDERIQERKAICELYDSELPSLQRQVRDAAVVYNYSYYPVIFEKEEQLLKVIDALNQAGIYPRRYFYPSLDTLPYLEGTARAAVSRDISTRILCLPLYADLPPEKAFEIAGLVRKNL